MKINPPLIHVIRGKTIEEVHRGSIAVSLNGRTIASLGDVNSITIMRSTAKPFQILPLIEGNGISKFNLTQSDISVMVSSHNGENRHIERIKNILSRNGIDGSELFCGIHMPYSIHALQEIMQANLALPTPFHNNCSGKHAGMLLTCLLKKFELKNYWNIAHPLQKIILNVIANILDCHVSEIYVSLDGCGVPTFGIPLYKLAIAYEKLATSVSANDNSHLALIGGAMMFDPFMLAGTERIETEVMNKYKYILKSGSSGVFTMALPDKKIGIALKMESGSEDASEVVAINILYQMGLISESDDVYLKYGHKETFTCTNFRSGSYEPVFSLKNI